MITWDGNWIISKTQPICLSLQFRIILYWRNRMFGKCFKCILSWVYNEASVPSPILELQLEDSSTQSLKARCFPWLFVFLKIILRESLHTINWKENRNIKTDLHKNYEDQTSLSSYRETNAFSSSPNNLTIPCYSSEANVRSFCGWKALLRQILFVIFIWRISFISELF